MCDAIALWSNTSAFHLLEDYVHLTVNTSLVAALILNTCYYTLLSYQWVVNLNPNCQPRLPSCGSTHTDSVLSLTTVYVDQNYYDDRDTLWWFQYGDARLEAEIVDGNPWLSVSTGIAMSLPPLPFGQDVEWHWNWSISTGTLTMGYNSHSVVVPWPPPGRNAPVPLSCGMGRLFGTQLVAVDAIRYEAVLNLVRLTDACTWSQYNVTTDAKGRWQIDTSAQLATATYSLGDLLDCAPGRILPPSLAITLHTHNDTSIACSIPLP